MSTVTSITSAAAAAMMLAASAGALSAQETQDTTTPWFRRGPTTFPSQGSDTATTSTTTTGTVGVTDASIIRQATAGNAMEIRLSRIAQSRADDDDVEDFADRMVADHSAMNRQWITLAGQSRVSIDTDATTAEEQTADRLEDLSGDDFDRAYMSEMIRHHERDLAAFQRAATTARSPEVRRLASSGVTAIQEHLTLARDVANDIGVASVATGLPDTTRGPDWTQVPRDTQSRDVREARRRNDDRDDRDRDDRGALRGTDRAFVMEVLADHLMHIRLAERAEREARNGDIRRFADEMEKDFSRWQERWVELAERHDVKAPKNLGRNHNEKVQRLEKASRQQVDRTYATIVADHLASIVPYFEKEGREVRNSAVRRLVREELPLIREHLARARRLQAQASARAERD